MKKKLTVLMAALMAGTCLLAGCGNKQAAVEDDTKQEVQTAEPAAADTEAIKETAATEEETVAGNQVILVVSFGTSYNDSREVTIGAIEKAIEEANPDYEVRRAFTSQIIIDKLKERDGLEIDSVEEALDRAVADGIKTLVVQPTHLMNGFEYTDLETALKDYEGKFDKVVLAQPLLSSDADFDAVISAITEHTESYDDGETAICFMGHGTEADSNAVYEKLQEKITAAGFENYFVGTVEAEPSLEDVIAAVKEKGSYKKVVLEPLMVVAGDHANNDMAGDEEDSWKSTFEAEGFEVECLLEGLGQNEAIQKIYVEHTKEAIDSLAE
ncbi:MAG: sirohydrochlorin cobaltochelatase [Clostridiales bacterium]|nr:sirohydrochlorin cobaltochelatase [Clostridiales bacterium]